MIDLRDIKALRFYFFIRLKELCIERETDRKF